MSSTAQNEIALDGTVDDTEDDFQRGFEELDNNSHSTNPQKLADFLILLQNPRLDDAAIKIKEQCIYRYYCVLAPCLRNLLLMWVDQVGQFVLAGQEV